MDLGKSVSLSVNIKIRVKLWDPIYRPIGNIVECSLFDAIDNSLNRTVEGIVDDRLWLWN